MVNIVNMFQFLALHSFFSKIEHVKLEKDRQHKKWCNLKTVC